MNVHILDLTIILLYLLLMLYLGYRGWRMSRTSEDYLLAGRRLGYFMYTGCLAAVVLGGASTVGGSKLGYEYGISGMWMVFMIGLGIMALGLFLTTRLSGLRILSISELLELRFNRHARLMSALIMAVYAALIAVIQVIAIGTILSAMVGWTITTGMLVGGLVVVGYTFLGGMWSVSLTDFIQFALMTLAIFFLILPAGIIGSGGWNELAGKLPASHLAFDTIGYDTIFAYFLLFCLGLIISQDVWQRVFTARDARVARRGTIIAGAYCILYSVATAVIGMVAAVRFPGLEDPQMAFATVAVELLPAGVSGLVLAGSMSALMSTASGPLLASSTLIASDIYRRFIDRDLSDRKFLWIIRCVTAATGLVVILCALVIQDVIKVLDIAYTLLTGSIFLPVLAAFFWKRANAPGTLASMCLSCLAAISAMIVWGAGSTPPIMIGLATSLATLPTVSLLTKPPSTAQLSIWNRHIEPGTGEP